ncbi:Type 4a pilus biogenesis protein PilO [Candidatus Magnetomoraceae bacterium gMMP-15]
MDKDILTSTLQENKLLKNLLISFSVVLILNLIFYIVFIKDLFNRIDELSLCYAQKRNTQIIRTDDNNLQYIQAKKNIEYFQNKLLPMSDFTKQIRELFDLLESYGLSTTKITFKPDKLPNLSLWKYTTNFTVSGQYSKLKSLLGDIQNSPSLFCIENLSLVNRSNEHEEHVDMNLTISTYFQ